MNSNVSGTLSISIIGPLGWILIGEIHACIIHFLMKTSILDYALHFPKKRIDEGFKYLGFYLKPNDYRFENRMWLFKKV